MELGCSEVDLGGDLLSNRVREEDRFLEEWIKGITQNSNINIVPYLAPGHQLANVELQILHNLYIEGLHGEFKIN